MKKIFVLFTIAFAFIACEGDRGPVGPPGPPGSGGDSEIGHVYDIEVNFNPQNNYSAVSEFPLSVEVFETDVVLVYLLESQISDPTGPVDVWSPLPQTFYLDFGDQVSYNFNHTFFDVNIFLDGNINLDALGPEFTSNQIFRVVILPATEANSLRTDTYQNLKEDMVQQDKSLEEHQLDL